MGLAGGILYPRGKCGQMSLVERFQLHLRGSCFWWVYKLFTQMCQISLAFSKGVGYDMLALRDNEC